MRGETRLDLRKDRDRVRVTLVDLRETEVVTSDLFEPAPPCQRGATARQGKCIQTGVDQRSHALLHRPLRSGIGEQTFEVGVAGSRIEFEDGGHGRVLVGAKTDLPIDAPSSLSDEN